MDYLFQDGGKTKKSTKTSSKKGGNFLGSVGELVAPTGWESFATTAGLFALDRADAALRRGKSVKSSTKKGGQSKTSSKKTSSKKGGNFLGSVGELVAPTGWESLATAAGLLAIDRADAALRRGKNSAKKGGQLKTSSKKGGNFLGAVGDLVAPTGWESFATAAGLLAIDRADAALRRGKSEKSSVKKGGGGGVVIKGPIHNTTPGRKGNPFKVFQNNNNQGFQPNLDSPLDEFLKLNESYKQLPKKTGMDLYESWRVYFKALEYLRNLKISNNKKFNTELQRLKNSEINYNKFNHPSAPYQAGINHIKTILEISDY